MSMGIRPLTPRDRELLEMAPIASQMPVAMKGGAVWDGLDGMCATCGLQIPAPLLRGQVSRPNENVAVIEAVGVCPDCRLATPFLYRLHHDMRITGLKDGVWRTWRPTLGPAARMRILTHWGLRTMARLLTAAWVALGILPRQKIHRQETEKHERE